MLDLTLVLRRGNLRYQQVNMAIPAKDSGVLPSNSTQLILDIKTPLTSTDVQVQLFRWYRFCHMAVEKQEMETGHDHNYWQPAP